MTIVTTEAYRAAFQAYLRKGTPIRLSLKQATRTGQYVWQTARDGRVRPSHRANDGRLFDWANAPETGHPGEGFNCRCSATPFIRGETEFAFHTITTFLGGQNTRWNDGEFTTYYLLGSGEPVTLEQIGHLREIVEQYAYEDGAFGAFSRLSGQIARAARDEGAGSFEYEFGNVYDFGDVDYVHGNATVRGLFKGVARRSGEMIEIQGASDFWFSDVFTDPFGNGTDIGRPYIILGDWSADFRADVFADPTRSTFVE